MKLNKLSACFLSAGLACAAAPAMAQTSTNGATSVTVYGILDTGVEYITHANAAGNSVLRMPGITGSMPSRIGFRGTEDLGGGLAAQFVLENGFNARAGDINQGGRLFGRQAWVGINSPYGLVSLGRQYNMMFWAILDADIIGPDIYGGVGSFDAYIPNARSDNTVAYKGKFDGVTIGATYSFGRDGTGTGNSPGQGTCGGEVAGDTQACRDWSAMLRYDGANFGIATAYDRQQGGTGAAANFYNGVAPFALTSSGDKDARTQLNGYFKAGDLKVGGGWLGRKVTAAIGNRDVKSDQYYLTAAYLFTPQFTLDGGYYRIINQQQDARGTISVVRGTYALSKRTSVYLQTAYLSNSAQAAYTLSQGGAGASPGKGMNQWGTMIGMRHAF